VKALPAPLTHPWFEAHFYNEATDKGHRGEWEFEHLHPEPYGIDWLPYVVPFAQAQGLALWCPCGFGMLDKDGGERYPTDLIHNKGRPHGIIVPFANPPSGIPCHPEHGPISRSGTHPRWQVSGTGLADLTTAPSIAVGDNPECWHGWITGGSVHT
jgi:hypothetical protein